MAAGRNEGLLRRRQGPQESTFLELFFDLAFVFALTRVSGRLVEVVKEPHRGVLLTVVETILLLLALWWVWSFIAWMTSRHDPQAPAIQLIVLGTMVGTVVLAVALPRAFGADALIFAATYITINIGRSLVFLVLVRGGEVRASALRTLFWLSAIAAFWIAGAISDGAARTAWWAVAVAVEYSAARLGYPTPRLGRTPATEFTIAGRHLAQRYQQFFIIALGELILVMGLTLVDGGFTAARTAAFLVAFVTTALLWRIYFFRAGEVLGDAIAASHNPGHLGRSTSYTHLIMIAGVIVTAVGFELLIEHPLGHTDPYASAALIGGPAVFLAGRIRLEYSVFTRISWPRVAGLLVLASSATLLNLLPPLGTAVNTILVLAAVAVLDAVRGRTRPPTPPAPI